MLASSLRATLAASISVSIAICPAVLMASKRKYYAVVAGHEPGIYETWAECELQVKGFKGQKYKSFKSKVEADQYMEAEGSKLICTVASTQVPKSSTTKAATSVKTQGAQVAVVNNPFKNYAFQNSSSLLEMAPTEYEELRLENCTTELTIDQITPVQLPTSLNRDLGLVSDVDALYQMEYDGASKGNPGIAGAGALLRHPDGTVVCEVSVGLGKATNNVAEYRGLIAGMRKALDLGIQRIQVQGDSKLVTMQVEVEGRWKINNANLLILQKEAVELQKNFKEFRIRHVDREWNADADKLANKGVGLPEEKFVSSFALAK